MSIVRTCSILFLAAALSVPVYGQASRTVTRSFDMSPDGTVSLATYKGRVDVEPGDTETVRVEVRIEADEQDLVDKTRIRFDASTERVEIETDYDELQDSFLGFFNFGSTDRPETYYTIRIPRTASFSAETYSAPVRVSSRMEGELTVDAYSGDIEALGVRSLRANTYSGDVRTRRVDGSVQMDTYSGDLEADSVSGSVQFTSYSGSATLGFSGSAADSRFDSYSGDVTLRLPSGGGAIVETNEGAFKSSLPTTIEQLDDDRIRATFGDGGPIFRFDTYSGDIIVERR